MSPLAKLVTLVKTWFDTMHEPSATVFWKRKPKPYASCMVCEDVSSTLDSEVSNSAVPVGQFVHAAVASRGSGGPVLGTTSSVRGRRAPASHPAHVGDGGGRASRKDYARRLL